jgi:tRNA(adenine34) deaminase
MCAGAAVLARIPTLVFGSYDPKAGACGTLYNIVEDRRLNHNIHVLGGICDRESDALLKDYFARKRAFQRKNVSTH